MRARATVAQGPGLLELPGEAGTNRQGHTNLAARSVHGEPRVHERADVTPERDADAAPEEQERGRVRDAIGEQLVDVRARRAATEPGKRVRRKPRERARRDLDFRADERQRATARGAVDGKEVVGSAKSEPGPADGESDLQGRFTEPVAGGIRTAPHHR